MTVKIGLTGRMGTGKSAALQLFENLGARTMSADRTVHSLLEDEGVARRIAQLFGEDVLTPGGAVNKEALSRRVFSDPGAIAALESLLHPLVEKEMVSFIEECRAQDAPACVVEVPLLFEAEMDDLFDFTVALTAPEETILKRLEGRGLSREQAQARLARQMSGEQHARLADFVVDNSGTLQDLEKAIEGIWNQLGL